MSLRILITGGTIDCDAISPENQYSFDKTHLPEMLKQARVTEKPEIETLFLKDSTHMTDGDREVILEACKSSREQKILITHGTDTMAQTAQTLGKSGLAKTKTIVLLGAMIPYNQDHSDALFNLGCAFASVQILGP